MTKLLFAALVVLLPLLCSAAADAEESIDAHVDQGRLELTGRGYDDAQAERMLSRVAHPENVLFLFLDENRLTRFPDLSRFSRLQQLSLSRNQIEKLERRDLYGRLPDLEVLQLDNNELTELEPGCFDMSRLEYLDLSSNRLAEVPKALPGGSSLWFLRQLDLTSNPLPSSGVAELELELMQEKRLGEKKYKVWLRTGGPLPPKPPQEDRPEQSVPRRAILVPGLVGIAAVTVMVLFLRSRGWPAAIFNK